MGVKFIVPNELVSSTITASSASSVYPASNLLDYDLNKVWRSTGITSENFVNSAVYTGIISTALINTNLTNLAMVTLETSYDGFSSTFQKVFPYVVYRDLGNALKINVIRDGSITKDFSPYGLVATNVNNVTMGWDSTVGTYAQFNGSASQALYLENISYVMPQGTNPNFSIVGKLYITQAGTRSPLCTLKFDDNNYLFVEVGSDNKLKFEIKSSGGGVASIQSVNTISINTLHDVKVTRANGKLLMSVDGVMSTPVTETVGIINTAYPSFTMYLGWNTVGSSARLDGRIADFQFMHEKQNAIKNIYYADLSQPAGNVVSQIKYSFRDPSNSYGFIQVGTFYSGRTCTLTQTYNRAFASDLVRNKVSHETDYKAQWNYYRNERREFDLSWSLLKEEDMNKIKHIEIQSQSSLQYPVVFIPNIDGKSLGYNEVPECYYVRMQSNLSNAQPDKFRLYNPSSKFIEESEGVIIQ